VSSKTMTPLQSRLQPCSGWNATVRAAARPGAVAAGHGGQCAHMRHLPESESSFAFTIDEAMANLRRTAWAGIGVRPYPGSSDPR
jgi:hypothetical protein